MTTTHEAQVRDLLQQWAAATRKGQRDDVLANHLLHMLMRSRPQKLLHVCKCLSAAVSGAPIPKAYRWHLPR